MSIIRLAAAATLALPGAVFASNTFNVTAATCTGSLVASYTDGLSLACAGDFSLSNGVIESDTSILLSATGALKLEDITLSAPVITLNSGGSLAFGDGNAVKPVSGASSSLSINTGEGSWGTVVPGSGAIIGVVAGPHVSPGAFNLAPFPGNVPEPESLPLLVAGLMAIGLVVRWGAKA